jgi:hypothetical protein
MRTYILQLSAGVAAVHGEKVLTAYLSNIQYYSCLLEWPLHMGKRLLILELSDGVPATHGEKVVTCNRLLELCLQE